MLCWSTTHTSLAHSFFYVFTVILVKEWKRVWGIQKGLFYHIKIGVNWLSIHVCCMTKKAKIIFKAALKANMVNCCLHPDVYEHTLEGSHYLLTAKYISNEHNFSLYPREAWGGYKMVWIFYRSCLAVCHVRMDFFYSRLHTHIWLWNLYHDAGSGIMAVNYWVLAKVVKYIKYQSSLTRIKNISIHNTLWWGIKWHLSHIFKSNQGRRSKKNTSRLESKFGYTVHSTHFTIKTLTTIQLWEERRDSSTIKYEPKLIMLQRGDGQICIIGLAWRWISPFNLSNLVNFRHATVYLKS